MITRSRLLQNGSQWEKFILSRMPPLHGGSGHKRQSHVVKPSVFVHDWGRMTVNFTCRMCAQFLRRRGQVLESALASLGFWLLIVLILFQLPHWMWGVTFVLVVLKNVNTARTQTYCYCCLSFPVGPAASLRRGTCVLGQGEVFLRLFVDSHWSLCSFTLFFYT